MICGLGWIPDPPAPPHAPDQVYGATRQDLPPAADLRPIVGDVLMQGRLASCSANAAMKAIQMRHRAQGIVDPPLGSRLFSYYGARGADGAAYKDSGATLRGLFSSLATLGFCDETLWPYSDADGGDPAAPFRRKPPADILRMAYDQRGSTSYQRIASAGDQRLAEVRAALADGYPVVFGCGVGDDFLKNAINPRAPLDPPAAAVGQHAMLFVGYGSDGFLVLNSWSDAWGDNGYCVFSDAYVAAAGDVWIVEHVPPPEVP